jgi:hypothetical protein
MRTDKSKPRGIVPPSVRFADEAINGDEPAWQQPNMLWDYFEWKFNVGAMILDQLLFTYSITHDQTLLEPMFAELELIKSQAPELDRVKQTPLVEGSKSWAADKLIHSRSFWSVVVQWRLITGDTRWDELIVRYGPAYGRFRISGEEKHLMDALHDVLDSTRYNVPLLTSEALHTDRVYIPGWEQLKAMLTGDGMPESSSPYFAVTWEKTDDGFTALVREASIDRLQCQIFSHSLQPSHAVMRLWQLAPGTYRLISEGDSQKIDDRPIKVAAPGERILLNLPSRRLLTIRVQKQEPSDVSEARIDSSK